MAGRIPRRFIDDLINRIDIVDLIDSYVPLRKTGRNYTALCPFHNEKTPSFSVSSEKQFYYCFGCGVRGSVISFLMNFAHLSFVEAVHELASKVGLEVPYEQGTAPPTAAFDDLYHIMAQAARYYQQQLRYSQTAIDYLKKRGVTGEIARDFSLGYAPATWDSLLKILGTNADMRSRLLKTGLSKQNQSGRRYDHFRDRVMFPILDRRGRVIAFGGRKLLNDAYGPKYLNSPETPLFQKGRELYGWYFARQIRSLRKIIIVEGYMDVVALTQYGIPNVVATLGTATTVEHLILLFRTVPEIIFCFDGDEGGQKAAWRALEIVLPLLQEGRQVNFVFLPQGYDPDTLIRQEGTEAFQARLTQAIALSNFLFNHLMQQVDMRNLDGRARLVELAKPFLKQLPLGTYRDLMLQRLSELTHLNLNNLTQQIQKREQAFKTRSKKSQILNKNTKQLSLVHKAIVYLLHQPTLSLSVDYSTKTLLHSNQVDIKLLLKLIEFTRMNPKITLGGICEHWRGTEHENTINQLAMQKSLFTEININISEEFRGAINHLYKNYVTQRQAQLQEKITELSHEEKQELNTLLQFMGQKSH